MKTESTNVKAETKPMLTTVFLAPYLPYRLNCYGRGEVIESTQYTENPINKLLTITGLDTDWVITTDDSIMIEDCMPILRPLSDLKKEEINSFSVSVRLALRERNSENLLSRACYYELNWLLERHYDVFGLIEKCLAISISA